MKKSLFSLSFAFLAMFLCGSLAAQTDGIVGLWKTIDDDGVTEKSLVEIFEKDGKVYGKVVELFDPPEANPVCEECEGDRKNQPVIGMEIIRDLTPKGDGITLTNGTICDPENGKVYKTSIWREGDDLMVRGYIGFLFRTQTWKPAK